ncbi:hemolysin III family protein [Phyllobacterium sp. UNC302MFCol5.2]|uniref:PAQR family membrane homeostasis protein TrhA n=1 Tax=Phyllobacterium sp. UNC302MFCol5.2 TaxID=1449065 RepID=UPI00068D8703|nr:hemolysin III family protein [Phyllobacterium sp. UNC302MFCol5.2]
MIEIAGAPLTGPKLRALPVTIFRRYSVAELWADGVVHVLGTTLAIVGSIILLTIVLGQSAIGTSTATAIYVGTLVLSMGLSATYNIWPESPIKYLLRRFDHSAIYLLIAGTYTPFMAKSGTWWLLAGVWATAVVGVVLKLVMPGRFDRLAIGLYLLLGWSGVSAYHQLEGALSASVLWLILAGGIVYSCGVIFHVLERLPFHNAIWHSFVLTAAGIHFAAVYSVVV